MKRDAPCVAAEERTQMRIDARAMWAVCSVLLACGDEASMPSTGSDANLEQPEGGEPSTGGGSMLAESSRLPGVAGGGQTGAGSAPLPVFCEENTDCEQAAEELIEAISATWPTTELASSECVRLLDAPPDEPAAACVCRFPCSDAQGERVDIFPGGLSCTDLMRPQPPPGQGMPLPDPNAVAEVNLLYAWRGTGPYCYPGDRLGRCYFDPEHPPSCDPEAPATSCAEPCANFEAAWHAAARGHDIELRAGICVVNGCTSIFRAEGECYVSYGRGLAGGPYDCVLSDRELLEEFGTCVVDDTPDLDPRIPICEE
jgi:hypothetical protein